MPEPGFSHRTGPQSQALAYSFEKAGLTLHSQPIPWNADAVLVEAQLQAGETSRRLADYRLSVRDRDPIPAESLRPGETIGSVRVFFRFSPPAESTTAELLWRHHTLGQMTLPVLSAAEFVRGLNVKLPTVQARLGEPCVACQTFVATQCKGLLASGVLTSPVSLAPLIDLGLRVRFQSDRAGRALIVPVSLSSTQLGARQALVTAVPGESPRRVSAWSVDWIVGDTVLSSQRAHAIALPAFLRSLRVSEARFVVEGADGSLALSSHLPPLEQAARIGPSFLVSSGLIGMAGICKLSVHARVPGEGAGPLLLEQTLLVTDGPTLFAPGTLDRADLEKLTAFELRQRGQLLGELPIPRAPSTPTVKFTSEGGFEVQDSLHWTPRADQELADRLRRLMDGPRG